MNPRPAQHGGLEAESLQEAAELAVQALMEIVHIEGNWAGGYKVSDHMDPTVRAMPEEWAEAAWAVCELQRWVP